MDLDTSLEELSWIPRPRILALRRLALETVGDLLTHYPRRHEDRREFRGFPREETIVPVCLCGEVAKTRLMRFGGRKIFEAVLEESGAHALSQPLTCRWFNLHYIQKMIATGQRLVVFGRVKRKGPRLLIDHPEFEVIEDDEEILIHFRRITPIYPSTEGLSQRVLRALIFRLLEEVAVAPADVPLPASLSNGEDENALRKIHFPRNNEQLRKVRDHLVLGEFFRMQMQIAAARAESESLESAGYQPAVSGSLPDTTPSGISEPRYQHQRVPHFERPWSKYAITFSTRNRRILSERARDVVLESIRRWDGRRYELFGACVMPNHVHLLIEPMVERQNESGNSIFFSLSKILHSIKSFTANRINKIERSNAPVWENESFDRMIRSESDLQEKFEYITRNPWDAGIAKPKEDYRWVWYPRPRQEEFAAGCRERQAGSLRSPAEDRNNAPQIIV